MKKDVYKINDVVVPFELKKRFEEYTIKFGRFFFDKYLVNKYNSEKLSKYRITISNVKNPFIGASNVVYTADVRFITLEEEVTDLDIKEKYFTKELHEDFLNAAVMENEYFIEVYSYRNSLQANLSLAPSI